MIKFHDILISLFTELNNKKIKYCVIRNYGSVEEINEADDLDISIAKTDKATAISIFINLGWMTPAINYNKYGHQQFFKWDGSRLYKVDIIWDFSFANGEYILTDSESIYKNTSYLLEAKIPNENKGLQLLCLHVILDKRALSDNNFKQIERMSSASNANAKSKLASKLLNDDFSWDECGEIITQLIDSGVIFKNSKSTVFMHRAFSFCKRICLFFQKKKFKIAIIGLDGTGKSTVVKALGDYYKEKSITQYFGFKDYETQLAKKRFNGNYKNIAILSPIKTAVILYLEMLSRYKKVMKSKPKLKIFDRYVWESYDNEDRLDAKLIYKFLFKLLFPKVDGIIYLYCPADISINRKDDIDDVEVFLKMKRRIDSIYLNKKNLISIDTNANSKQEVTGIIVSNIFKITNGNFS